MQIHDVEGPDGMQLIIILNVLISWVISQSKLIKDGKMKLFWVPSFMSKDIGTMCLILERMNYLSYCQVIRDHNRETWLKDMKKAAVIRGIPLMLKSGKHKKFQTLAQNTNFLESLAEKRPNFVDFRARSVIFQSSQRDFNQVNVHFLPF